MLDFTIATFVTSASIRALRNSKQVITISITNGSSHSLEFVDKYYKGNISKPPDYFIGPHNPSHSSHAQFEGKKGMLCYKIRELYGSKGPCYLLISWKLSRCGNSKYSVTLQESREKPLNGNQRQMKKVYKSVHDKYKILSDENIQFERDDFIIGATMSSVNPAELKIHLYPKQDSNPEHPKKTGLFRKILLKILEILIILKK